MEVSSIEDTDSKIQDAGLFSNPAAVLLNGPLVRFTVTLISFSRARRRSKPGAGRLEGTLVRVSADILPASHASFSSEPMMLWIWVACLEPAARTLRPLGRTLS
jgi:hypothetical protein